MARLDKRLRTQFDIAAAQFPEAPKFGVSARTFEQMLAPVSTLQGIKKDNGLDHDQFTV